MHFPTPRYNLFHMAKRNNTNKETILSMQADTLKSQIEQLAQNHYINLKNSDSHP